MADSINISKNETSAAEASGKSAFLLKNQTEKGNVENASATKDGSNDYKLSFSDDAWEALDSSGKDSSEKDEISEEEQRKIDELEKIDRNVRTHEQAHLSAAGGYARGGANFSYVTGPDGKRYANAGHVNIDTSPEKTPEATIRKAEIIRKAALAPADPSPSDRQIAAEATKMMQNAQKELVDNIQTNSSQQSQNFHAM